MSTETTNTRFWQHEEFEQIVKRFKTNKLALIGLVIFVVYVIIGLLAPHILPHDPSAIDSANRFVGPSLEHPFGTDRFGRDVLSRVIMGARLSLIIGGVVVLASAIPGIILGLTAGFYRGKVDEFIMRFADLSFAFPALLMGLLVIAILGPGLTNAIIALSILFIPIMTRIVRGSALQIREEDYIMAARSVGENNMSIMFREMLPNLISVILIQATITFAFAILLEAGLSFLGLSAQPPTPTWGVMISEGRSSLSIAPWITVFPGVAIMLAVLSLTFVGVGLRDALDPRTDVETGGTFGL